MSKKKLNQKETAAACGVTVQTLHNWQKQGCPITRGPAAIMAWKAKQATASAPASSASAPDDLRDRLLRAQAEHYETKTRLAELEHQVKTGSLVSLDYVEDLLRRWYAPVWNAIKTLDARLSHQVNPSDPEHARKILRAEVGALCKLGSDVINDGN